MIKTVSGRDLRKMLRTIIEETVPLPGHTDPGAIQDRWDEVFETLDMLERELPELEDAHPKISDESPIKNLIELRCNRCGHTWNPRGSSKPKVCPSCKRTDWDEEKPIYPQLECKRCGHTWTARSINLPKYCPKCKSSKWNQRTRG